jgi:uncharacterized protein YjbI with pentapeptide repeats
MEHANLASGKFSSANLSHANLTGAYAGCAFHSRRNQRPYKFNWTEEPLGASFRGARLDYAVLETCDLTRAVFTDANLANAAIESAHAEFASFDGADLTGASFRLSVLESANFLGCTVGHRELSAEEQSRIDGWLAWAENSYSDASAFPERQVQEFISDRTRCTSFSGAKLNGARFDVATLSKAHFGDADITGIVTSQENNEGRA